MPELTRIDRTIVVPVTMMWDGGAEGYHVYMAGLYIGFLRHLSETVRVSFLPGMAHSSGMSNREFDSIDHFLHELTVIRDVPNDDFK